MATTMSLLTPEQRELFLGRNFAQLATICPNGHPHVAPVWIDIDSDETILVNTAEGRVKERNMQREPRVAISIYDMENPYRMVAVQGVVVEITPEGAADHIDKLSRKYTGKPYPTKVDRRIVRIRPERVASMGF